MKFFFHHSKKASFALSRGLKQKDGGCSRTQTKFNCSLQLNRVGLGTRTMGACSRAQTYLFILLSVKG